MKLQQCAEYSNIVSVSNKGLKQSLQQHKTPKKGTKNEPDGRDLRALNCCRDVACRYSRAD